MRIHFFSPATKAAPWVEGLRAALPQAEVCEWTPGAPPADYAVVWSPPQRLLDEQLRLKALFNMGAGVDALMKLRLPPGLQVVRLDDAGMSVQMAEYVCHAVLRQFREFEGYEQDAKARRWGYRRPRATSTRWASWAWACWARAWRTRCASSSSRSTAGAARRAKCPACAASRAQASSTTSSRPRACWCACCR